MMLLCLAEGSYFDICMQLHDAMLGHQHLHWESQRAVCLRLLELQRVFQTTVCGVGYVHCISVLVFAERIHIQLNLLCYAACKRKWFDTDKTIMHIQSTGPALQSVNNGEIAIIRLTNVFCDSCSCKQHLWSRSDNKLELLCSVRLHVLILRSLRSRCPLITRIFSTSCHLQQG